MQATLSRELFRQKLAGLADPSSGDVADSASAYKTQAVSLAVIMARVFSDTLDRKTLWERIGTGLRSSATKRPEGGENMIAAALDHVLAEHGKAATLEELGELIGGVMSAGDEWNRAWAAYLVRCSTIVCVHARARWQEIKDAK